MVMKKILLIDDDPKMLKAFFDKFSREGFEVVTASSGVVGIDLAKKECPDLILLDILMPGIDGIEVLKRLKDSSETQNIPVAMLTVLDKGVEEIKKDNPHLLDKTVAYFRKDLYSLEELVGKVRSILGK